MKAFSPAGMAVKGLFGYSRLLGVGAKTFGNPDGAISGGGAYAAGGANANGPHQGGGGSSPSPPGVWTVRPSFPLASVSDIASDSTRMVLLDGNGKVAYSDDQGATWTLGSGFSVTNSGRTLATNGSGLWVAVCDNGVTMTSADGATWSVSGTIAPIFGTPTMVYGAGFFVVTTASSAENVDCYNSADGATWAGQGTGTPDILALNLFDGVRFVGSATFTPNIAFSGNAGATWTQTPAPQFDGINAMAFQGGVYVATDGGSPSVIQKSFSPNWSGTDIIQPLTDDAAAVAFGEGVWCLVGDVLGGTTPQAAISTDLTSWSLEDLGLGAAEFEDMRGVAAAGGVLVAWTFSGKVTTRVVKVAVSWTQTNGNSSTGPLQGAGFDGDGSGFYDATVALNGGFGCGSTVPSPVAYAGAHLSVSGWGSSSPMGGGYYSIVLVGTLPQSFFTKVSLGPPANLTFLTAGANHYSTTDFPGFTVWAWSDSHEFAFFPPLLVTITP